MTATRNPTISRDHDVTVVALGPEYESLDEFELDDLRDALLKIASTADPPRVVLDLSHTRFFGSAFIELLFRAWNRLNSRNSGKFAISGLTPYCKEVIEITHLDQLWDVYDTTQQAVKALGRK